MRKASRQIQPEDIWKLCFELTPASLTDPVLRGHLAVEALLVEIIQTSVAGDHIWRKSFPEKTAQAASSGFITSDFKRALDAFNDFRNDFAHIFGHAASFGDVHSLACRLQKLGVDFSDDIGLMPETTAGEWYTDERTLFAKILWALLSELAFTLMDASGRQVLP